MSHAEATSPRDHHRDPLLVSGGLVPLQPSSKVKRMFERSDSEFLSEAWWYGVYALIIGVAIVAAFNLNIQDKPATSEKQCVKQ